MDDPLMEMSNHLDDVHATELAKAWRRYNWAFWAFALAALLTAANFLLVFASLWFLQSFVAFGLLTMWLMARVSAARRVWANLDQWVDDAE